MKKILSYGALLLVVVCILVAIIIRNQKPMENDVAIMTYEYKQSDQIIKPSITLRSDKRFEFFYSVKSSYSATGTYNIIANMLHLETDDSKYSFIFKVDGNLLVFDMDKSIYPTDFIDVVDGTIFELV